MPTNEGVVEEVKPVPEQLVRRTVEFLGTWRDAGPECECEAPGHRCGWPKLRDLADEWRALGAK
jgi:hypothetical protein